MSHKTYNATSRTHWPLPGQQPTLPMAVSRKIKRIRMNSYYCTTLKVLYKFMRVYLLILLQMISWLCYYHEPHKSCLLINSQCLKLSYIIRTTVFADCGILSQPPEFARFSVVSTFAEFCGVWCRPLISDTIGLRGILLGCLVITEIADSFILCCLTFIVWLTGHWYLNW